MFVGQSDDDGSGQLRRMQLRRQLRKGGKRPASPSPTKHVEQPGSSRQEERPSTSRGPVVDPDWSPPPTHHKRDSPLPMVHRDGWKKWNLETLGRFAEEGRLNGWLHEIGFFQVVRYCDNCGSEMDFKMDRGDGGTWR